jgi:hypothetical protein
MTQWGWRHIGWTKANENKSIEEEIFAEARGVAKRIDADIARNLEEKGRRGAEAKQRFQSIVKRVIRQPYRERERHILDLLRENKARREEIKRAYRAKHPLRPTDTSTRRPTRTEYLGTHRRHELGEYRNLPRAEEPNEERMARSIAKFKLKRVHHEALRKEAKVVRIRPEIWSDNLFVTGKSCMSYTIDELKRILRKYEPDVVMSRYDTKGKLCDRLEQIKISLREFKNK